MTIQVLPNIFKKIGLLLFILGILIPFADGFLNPCEYNEELSLIYPFNFLLTPMFFGGFLLFFLSKRKSLTP